MNWNGGAANSSGTGISNINTQGNVHPDQFWQSLTLGNQDRPFSEIWTSRDHSDLNALRNRKDHLTGRCADCRCLRLCGGGFRVRALQMTGDLWAPDPPPASTTTKSSPSLPNKLRFRLLARHPSTRFFSAKVRAFRLASRMRCSRRRNAALNCGRLFTRTSLLE
ncbi:MAG TPA: SPASM domain-containing protein [Prosthecobacter sp.]|nr:SPASM domain-containing protein [Prosthecobacter sp.]